MSEARALSSEQISGLREELDNGTTPTVWFTGSAVGVDAGRSGKVVAMDEPAEGEFLQVKPAGSKDVLSFSAAEVTLDKPAPKRKETGRAAKKKGADDAQPDTPAEPARTGPTATASAATGDPGGTTNTAKDSGAAERGTDTVGTSKRSGGSASSSSAGEQSNKTESTGSKRNGTSRTGGSTSKNNSSRRPAGATIILTAGDDGHWSVEVSNGRKRVLRPTDVPASAVGQAAKALHDDVAQAVEPLLEAEREHQRARVEQLQRELDEAQRRLEELGTR
ncbi:hypothetical protein SAMN04487904_103383 [Actinopolyspora lacussalsi subsp. righensis]|uniref:Cell wall anchor protein n=1 Tax=Actinopolyspora righensis TaxID=995060 RepID=A0A1I6YYF9_9ACTN|nr:DUF6319 family protein [Actinopolyspora righensis]SFT55452.1 hypothetical protein SAMN04487904_103383 [Actinopolyspora righensis]